MSNIFTDGLDFVSDFWGNNLNGRDITLAGLTLDHLILSAKAVALSIVIGVPVGAVLGHLHRFSFLAINTSNVARALPTVAVLAILFPYTGIGDTTAIIALVILGAPPILTNTYVAIDGVDDDTVDAAKGVGLTAWQVLTRVELPLALPLIFAGVRTASVFVIATASLKGFFGGGGLGDVISNTASYGLSGVIGASMVLIGLALLAQIVFLIIEYAVTPRGLRRRRTGRFGRSDADEQDPTDVDDGDPIADIALTTSGTARPASMNSAATSKQREHHAMTRTRMFGRMALAALSVTAVTLSLAACGSDSSDGGGSGSASGSSGAGAAGSGGTIIMGTKDFDEQFLLGELYSQALKAKGFKVELKKNIGSSEIIDKALTSKKIDMYPEYTGVIYSNKDLANLGDQPKSADITYEGAKKWEAGRGYTMLERTPFQDADGLAVSKSYASKNGLKTIDDMSKVGSFTYAGPPENATRYQGVLGLKQAYKLTKINFKPLATGSQYAALDNGSVNAIAIFTTDGQLNSGKYAVLTDTKGIFGYQNVAPVIRNDVVSKQGAKFTETLNAVSKLLTTQAIVAMNSAVQLQKQDPAAVAKTFLDANKAALS